MSDPAPATMQGNANTILSNGALDTIVNIGTLTDKVALVTGASSGLGRAIAQAYAAAGAFVISADLTPEPPKAPLLEATLKTSDLTTPTVELITKRHGDRHDKPTAAFVHCDVTKAENIEAAVAFTVEKYGRLDIMVNNAGVSPESKMATFARGNGVTRIHETDVSVLDTAWAINGRGVWLGCKYACAQMMKQEPHASGDRGWIINMSSVLGLVGMPGATSYCATKGAVLQMTKSIALEYAKDRIHVNCIHPGVTETNALEPMRTQVGVEAYQKIFMAIHPWGRLGLPEDIAKMAVFLAGEGASWITGSSFVVDGGYIAQ